MRGIALAMAIAIAGCAPTTARHDRSHEISYNRRELIPSQGLLTGPSGEWTIHRGSSPADPKPATAEPDAPKQEPTVLLPAPR